MTREFVAKGPDGIRLVCRGASRCPVASDLAAWPLAELRNATEATVYALAEDPTSKADRAAVRVLAGALEDPGMGEEGRARCADALGEIGNYMAIEALEAAARREPEGLVGESAAAAIANIRGGRDSPRG